MKKRSQKILAGTMAVSSALLTFGCSAPSEPVCVYGPPSYFGEQEALPSPAAEETPEATSSPDPFDEKENIPVDVYGPPSYWDNGGAPGAKKE